MPPSAQHTHTHGVPVRTHTHAESLCAHTRTLPRTHTHAHTASHCLTLGPHTHSGSPHSVQARPSWSVRAKRKSTSCRWPASVTMMLCGLSPLHVGTCTCAFVTVFARACACRRVQVRA